MEKIKQFFVIFEVSGKAMLGIFSLGMFVACAFVVYMKLHNNADVELPTTVVDVYKWSLTLFAATKTATKLFKPKEVK